DRVDCRQYAEWQRSDEVAGDAAGAAYWAPRWDRAAEEDAPARLPRLQARRELCFEGEGGGWTRELVLACWAAVLARFTGAADVAVDVELDGRHVPDLWGVVGLVAECLPLRLRAGGAFEALLAAATRQVAEHEEWFEQVPGHRATAGRRSGALFSYVDQPARLHAGQVTVDVLEVRSVPSLDHGLHLAARRAGDGLSLTLDFDPGRHPRWQAARLLDSLAALARDARRRPRAPVAHLELLSPEEAPRAGVRPARLAGSGGDEAVPALFAARARERPDAVAVRGPDCRLTYAELDARSDALAAELARAGAGRGRGVGLYAEPTEDAVVGMLAIMKTGGYFVPLEPRDPPARLAAVVRDAAMVAILAGRAQGGRERLEALPSAPPVLPIDAADLPPRRAGEGPGPRDAAYVIYTSGSTGRPRGVLVEQRSLVAYLRWVDETVGRDVTIPATARLGFDACLKQLLAPLLAGRTVGVVSEAARTDGEALHEELAGIPRLALNCVPGLWEELLEVAARDPDGRLARVLVRLLLGGERVPAGVAARTAELFPSVEVWNLYGPTEATVNACAGRLLPGQPVRIGTPIAGATAHVLDHLLRPVPAGF
ncbi:MAG TPA: AMP-binding protein, partial [Candidatus Eisenbacteria bacterium]|nr:AMP-binding protein [Candidatus Eisenbacteria bacterium]